LSGLWSRRGRIFLGVVGLLLVGVPVVGVHMLVSKHNRDLAQRSISELADEFVQRSEMAIDTGLATLAELARVGVAACDRHDLELMRRAVFMNFWIEEVGIVRPGGNMLCNHFGDSRLVRVMSGRQALSEAGVGIQLVDMGAAGRSGVMLISARGPMRELSALIPGEALTTEILPRYLRSTATGKVVLADGSIIGVIAPAGVSAAVVTLNGARVETHAASTRYPIGMTLSAPLSAFAAQSGNLLTYAQYGSILLGGLIFGLFLYVLRGPPLALARLREAVERGEIIPYYQPVIDLHSGRLVGCEALVRWRKPDGTIVGADEFIRLAETSGIAWQMTQSLMRQIRDDLAPVYGDRPSLTIAINLFNEHFSQLRTVDDIKQSFGGSAIAYRQLVFELTERQPLGDIDSARIVIRRLQELGARIALDDAGTGHSGLAYLHQLGVNVVKIDKLFVDSIGENRMPTPIIDSLIRLGHALGMEVVAEGVETFEQLDYLRERGADSAQGYLFSPPLPAQAFLDLVRSMEPSGASLGRAAGRPTSAQQVA
jgi:sensor c-di-GMP phosphodiesterase-like protein